MVPTFQIRLSDRVSWEWRSSIIASTVHIHTCLSLGWDNGTGDKDTRLELYADVISRLFVQVEWWRKGSSS